MSVEVTVPVANRVSGQTTSVSFFTDDTIETVRIKIGIEVGIHHDRLRIYVDTQLPGSYYADDPRAWKNLFLRMSPKGNPLQDVSKTSYDQSRDVPFPFPDGVIDEARWMTDVPREFDASFHELRILGVPEEQSWIFPLDNTTDPKVLPDVADIARPANRSIFKSIHAFPFRGFLVVPYEEGGPAGLRDQYVPLLRPATPMMVQESIKTTISQQTTLLKTLKTLEKGKPKQTILRARWKIPLVETNIGEAPRNRFEQMFFGMTLSPDTPYVGFFTSRKEQTRHKFYTEDTVNKKPIVDLKVWAHWWTVSKPSRNRPTLLVYRKPPKSEGYERTNFDRLAVSATDIIISSQRPEGNTETLEELEESVLKWVRSLDALMPFIVEKDLTRAALQTSSIHIEYADELSVADFGRFDCLRGIYEITDKKALAFRFLRANGQDLGLTDQEVTTIQLLREDIGTSVADVEDVLNVTSDEAESLLSNIRERIADDPSILQRASQSLPIFRFSLKSALIIFTDDASRTASYVNILRSILQNPDDARLDDVCPKKGDVIERVSAVAPPAPPPEEEGDVGDLLGDLLAEVGGDPELNAVAVASSVGAAAAAASSAPPRRAKAKVVKVTEEETLYNYFNTRLQDFDPETFEAGLKKCDLARQPVVMSEDELNREGRESEFNPIAKEYPDAMILETEDPNGIFLCPEYWCVIDKIPLRQEDLIEGACPVCGGKVRDPKGKQRVTEYSVLKRSDKYIYPGQLKEKAANGKSLPCCFQKPQKTRVSKLLPLPPSRIELYYVLGETKLNLEPMRFAYLHPKTIATLGLDTNYEVIKRDQNRIQAGRSGVFRIGMGRPSETLAKTLGSKVSIPPPSANPGAVVRTSFFRSWNQRSEDVSETIRKEFPDNDVLAQMVQSIANAYDAHQLNPLDELEYCCIAVDCDLYRVLVDPDGTTSVGCLFANGFLPNKNQAIAVLLHSDSPSSIEYMGFVSRTSASADPQVFTNLFSPVFGDGRLPATLDAYRNKACWNTPLPTMTHVLRFLSASTVQPRLILDPYRRVQGFFFPKRAIVPFQPESLPETTNYPVVGGYADIRPDDLPPKDKLLIVLEKLAKFHRGYEYKEDLANSEGLVSEVVLASGLRIPVVPFRPAVPVKQTEVVETVRKYKEPTLTFGEPNQEDRKLSTTVRYQSEIFEFLLFELSKDLDDEPDLKDALVRKDEDAIREELSSWLESKVVFHELEDPPAFVSKIRTPCTPRDKKDCSGVCAWVGTSCRVDVKTFPKKTMENRLLAALVSNEKIRRMVLENRTSPFFSTVLYVEMPHELFLSDSDLTEYKNIARSE